MNSTRSRICVIEVSARPRLAGLALVSVLVSVLLAAVVACKSPAATDAAREPVPIRVELSVAPVVDHDPWVIAFLTEISITRPPGTDARLEGRTGPEGLRHPEPIIEVIETEGRDVLEAALATYERQHPRMPELEPVWQPDPFGPNERVRWRLYFVDTSKGFTLDDQARASLEPHDHGPSVHLQLGESQRQQFAELTRAQVGRRIAIVLADEVLMLPVIMAPVPDGNITLITNPSQDPKISAPALLERLAR